MTIACDLEMLPEAKGLFFFLEFLCQLLKTAMNAWIAIELGMNGKDLLTLLGLALNPVRSL